MGAQMTLPQVSSELVDAEPQATKRRRRQGSETRARSGMLQVRYDETKLARLENLAKESGSTHQEWMREVGDLLIALHPVAAHQGMSAAELLRAAVNPILAETA